MTIKIPVTILSESKALSINRKIKHKAKERAIKIFLKKMLKVNVIAKNKDTKNRAICIKFA